jgi:hypothetical protein
VIRKITPRRHGSTTARPRRVASLLVLAGCLSACAHTSTATSSPVSVGARAVAAAELTTATPADLTALEAAAESYWLLPSTCRVVPSGDVRMAVDASGTQWALVLIVPATTCLVWEPRLTGTPPGSGPGGDYPADLSHLEEFASTQDSTFMKPPGGMWTMGGLAGTPFPCPAPGGAAPGLGNGALPASVVRAFGLVPPSNCASVYFPPAPRD